MEPTRCILPRLWAALWIAATLQAWGQGAKPPELQPETLGVVSAISAGERVYVADIAISHITDGRLRVFDARSGRFVGMLASGYAGNFTLSNKADELYIATTYLSRGGRGERTDLLEVYDTASLSFKYEVVLPPKRAQALNYRGLVRASGDGRFVLVQNATPATSVTVVDLPVGANREALLQLLEVGVSIEYFDHHHAPQTPVHALLHLKLDAAPRLCTSLLVDRHLGGRFRAWAVVGAFGDNIAATAEELARSIGLDQRKTYLFRVLGECLNYNAYGVSEVDLTIRPAELRKIMAPFVDPFEFMTESDAFLRIAQRRAEDLELANAVRPILKTERLTAVLLPDAAWARRVKLVA